MRTPTQPRIHQPGERASAKSNYRERANPYRWQTGDRARWQREADDVAAYAETAPQFSPWQGDAVQLTDAERSDAATLIAGCPDSSSQEQRRSATGTRCPRAVRRWVTSDQGEPLAVWIACRSRTCAACRPRLDRIDAERVAETFGSAAYVAEVDADEWATMSKRLRRHGATAVRVPSIRDPRRIVVVADEPPAPTAAMVADVPSLVGDLMRTRPTGQARRLTTIGDIPSRAEWADYQRLEALPVLDSMSQHTRPEDIELAASALGVETTTTDTADGVSVRLHCPADDWRAVAVIRYAKNPSGQTWERMRRETLIAEGIRDRYEPPEWAYTEGLVA